MNAVTLVQLPPRFDGVYIMGPDRVFFCDQDGTAFRWATEEDALNTIRQLCEKESISVDVIKLNGERVTVSGGVK